MVSFLPNPRLQNNKLSFSHNSNLREKFDVVIIGAGISGLVCGCYLVRAGIKVLILEKNSVPGGCCTSFTRKGQIFDAFAHSIGGLRENSAFSLILEELEVRQKLIVEKRDPSDIVITPEYKIHFGSNLDQTICELEEISPDDASNIRFFFRFLRKYENGLNGKLIKSTFDDLLNEYNIKNKKLRAIFAILILGNAGLPPSLISAFTALKLFQEFIFDGGYYPVGGMQTFANLLAEKFKELGGGLLLSHTVRGILCKENRVYGIKLMQDELIFTDNIIANCDANQTFLNLLQGEGYKIPDIKDMIPSISMYINYLGVDKNILDISQELNSTVWYLFDYDLEKIYLETRDGNFENISWLLAYASPDKKGFSISILAPFQDELYWDMNKRKIADILVKKVNHLIPNMADHITFSVVSTPQTIYRWTMNHQGAVYGWQSTPHQFIVPGFTQITDVQGLYLTGHWTTQAFGISGVASIGKLTAKRFLNKKRHAK